MAQSNSLLGKIEEIKQRLNNAAQLIKRTTSKDEYNKLADILCRTLSSIKSFGQSFAEINARPENKEKYTALKALYKEWAKQAISIKKEMASQRYFLVDGIAQQQKQAIRSDGSGVSIENEEKDMTNYPQVEALVNDIKQINNLIGQNLAVFQMETSNNKSSEDN